MSKNKKEDNRFVRKLLNENVRIARREAIDARANIVSVEPKVNLGLDADSAPACIQVYKKTVVADNELDDLSVFTCENFHENKVCENTQCPRFQDNKKYIAAAEKEKTAIQVKREFSKERRAEFFANIIGFFKGKQRGNER